MKKNTNINLDSTEITIILELLEQKKHKLKKLLDKTENYHNRIELEFIERIRTKIWNSKNPIYIM